MGKMTQNTFSALYEFGKRVYSGELELKAAAQQMCLQNPEIAISSAKHYILWYSKMRSGEFLTWNSNSDLLLYYAKKIIDENGVEAGKMAICSALQFAKHVSRTELERDLNNLAEKNRIEISLSSSETTEMASLKNEFQNWLKNMETHNYTDHVIYKYTRALDMAEEWLSIKLPSPIFLISSLDEFDECKKIIKSQSNYVEVNKAHGHGDLSAAMSLYSKFLENKTNSNWHPSKKDYDPGITKEKWIELLNNSNVFIESALIMLAEFYAFGGVATCAQLASHYNKNYNSYLMTSVHLAERVVKETGCPVIREEKNAQNIKWWPVLYMGKDAGKEEQGTFIWKIREELYDALTEYNILQHLPKKDIKTEFFNYIGSENDLNGYQKSYKLVFYKAMIDSMDSDGKAREIDVTAKFRKFYEERANAGKITDKDVDPVIAKISESSDSAVRNVMIHNPFKVISDKGFVKKSSNATGENLLCFNEELMISLSGDDWAEIVRIIEAKLKLYYKQIDGVNGGEKEMTVKEKINAIKEYIAAKGFNYEGDLIENFYLSLKSKPFVILAGTSGTGKTRLVKLFAEAIGAKMKLVPVRPDWSDSSDLFGHTDLSGNFQPGAIIDFIKQAEWNSDTPYFLCLDEMNLARVEYYLSDFLSVIETRDRKANGEIETDPLVDVDYYKDSDAKGKYGRVFIPENLYIVGTVNMDETTFPFSKKVLDRANTIEFSYVNLMSMVGDKKETAAQKLDNSFLKTEYLYLRDCDDTELIESICFDLEELNQILVKANLHVGYRVRDEISFYMMNNKKADLLSKEAAFDNEIMQKILPRVQGSSAAIKDVLSELFIKCAGDYTGFSGNSAYEQMESYIESKECKYPNSAKKIKFMMRRYEEDGFTSYWL